MRIPCPHCGERGADEFAFHGDASVTRPDPDAPDASEAFYAYGYLRANVAGSSEELWFHAAGCQAWLVVTRDTRSHEILGVKPAREVATGRRAAAAGEGVR